MRLEGLHLHHQLTLALLQLSALSRPPAATHGYPALPARVPLFQDGVLVGQVALDLSLLRFQLLFVTDSVYFSLFPLQLAH